MGHHDFGTRLTVTRGLLLSTATGRRAFRTAALACLLAPAALSAQSRTVVSPILPGRGDASAPVAILVFSDFECSGCAQVDAVLEEVRKTFDRDVQVIFKHAPQPAHLKAPLAHEAAVEAGRQGRFWDMHDLLFADPKRLDKDDLVAHAATLGLDMQAFAAALEDGRHKVAVARDAAEARALGVTAAPTVFVNGQKMAEVPTAPPLIAYIRSVLSGTATDEETPVDPGAFDLTGSPIRGPVDAPVTIIEYSDFQCPFCGRATSIVDHVWKSYGGKVRWVFKHFPLDFHADAPLAHRAAFAAGAQGKFWEMHDTIFQNQRAMKRDDLLRHATGLGLDMTRFAKDLDDPAFDALLKRDALEGVGVSVNATPTFFINGQRLVGAQSPDQFKAVIDRALGRAAPTYVRPASGESVAPAALDAAMTRGPIDAPVTIRWYADFGSSLHKDAVALLKKVLASHPTDVRVEFHHRPLEGREDGRFAHQATLAAAEQGKFWELHDLLVARPLQNRETLATGIARLGLDRAWFEDALDSGRARAALERHIGAARAENVRGTPTFFVNGTRVDGVTDPAAIDMVIAKELKAVKAPR
jgi:protein-disulfide isomerase